VYLNASFRELLGIESEVEPNSSFDLSPYLSPEDWNRFRQSDQRVTEDGPGFEEMDLTFHTVKGRPITHIQKHAVPLTDGRTGYLSVGVAVLSKKTETQTGGWLFNQKERFRSVFHSIDYPFLIVSKSDGSILDLNESAAGFYGFSREVMCGKHLSHLSAESVDRFEEALARLVSDDTSEVIIVQKMADGSTRHVKLHASTIVFNGVDCRAVLVTDASERFRTEAELQETLRRAESASRARSEFLANTSHEFRTPVSGIIGIAALLKDSGLNDDQRHLVSLVDSAAGDLERMLRDLLDISRIDVGKVLIKREKFSVPSLVDRVIGLHSAAAGQKGLNVTFTHQNEKLFYGDETRLAQILGNLLSNAIKYTDHGGINVVSRCDSDLILDVSDTGIGIPDDKKAEIFEMFRQVENPYTKERPGLGLGLAIVRSLVDLMGGDITIQDAPEGGSLFRVLIPRSPDSTESNNEHAGAPKILIVEDDPLSRYYLSTILQKRGFDIVEAVDGESAVGLFSPGKYVAVLMDVGLPRMSGIDVTREFRRIESGETPTPIWAVTAHGFQTDKDRCFEAGMDEFFLKPVDEPQLTGRLMELVNARRK
ncbi:MAG: ATP-binding protein, partial [Spirochaetaceae bacterium]|nr:ATP-binding protein [Spirochaetaceae bacterium]